MLATQLNDLVSSGQLDTFAVIRLDKYLCNTISPDRRVMILLDVHILASGPDIGEKIGNPQAFKAGANGQDAGASSTAAPPATSGGAQGTSGGPRSAPAATATSGGSYYNKAPAKPAGGGGASGGVAGVRALAAQNPPNTPGGTPSKVHPIASLTPYQNRWCIKVRVTQKSSIRTWSNSRGEGKLFSMNLLDESGEIRATAFKNEVDKYYEMVELNKVYFIRKATLKTADKRYSSVNNDYEMTFNSDTEMIPCNDDTDLPSLNFNFIPINKMESHQAQSMIDVVGVVKSAADLSTVTSKTTSKEIKKRDIQLVDQTEALIRLTLWGNDAETFDASGCPVLAVKGARLSDWGGRSLSALASSQIIFNPDIPEAHELRGWYDRTGTSINFNEYRSDGSGGGGGGHSTNWKTFAEVKGESLGNEKADYYTAKGTVVFLKKENCMYMACPQADCNKKLVDQNNGMYRCEKCQKEYSNYKWRLILSANLVDFSDNQWITCFQETAESILGKTGEELGNLKENDEVGFDQVFVDASHKSYIFRMRAKMETYNDESRLKTVCVGATPLDFPEYNKKLLADIDTLLAA